MASHNIIACPKHGQLYPAHGRCSSRHMSTTRLCSSSSSSTLYILHALFLLVLVPICTTSHAATLLQDVEALHSLHRAWLSNPKSWDFKTDPCEYQWTGIRCDDNQTRVTQMLLMNEGLAGTLSSSIGNLTSLTDVDISSNPHLGGPLPADIGRLINAKRFFAQFCNFSGPIPSDIGNMTSLKYLGLVQNDFTGPLPATLGLLKDLNWLDVTGNSLSGPIPVSSTSGIGSGLDNLTNAQHFHLQKNKFSGEIPPSLFVPGMQLVHLMLNSNKLSGHIPPTITELSHLEILCLDDNALTGALDPLVIGPLPNLMTLKVDNNILNGQLPDLSINAKLQMLSAGHNPFQASEIPSWIMGMTNIYYLSLDSTNLTGSIPPEIFGISPTLISMSLGSNHLNGTLSLIDAASSLIFVNLTDNDIIALEKGIYEQKLLMVGNPYCTRIDSIECTTAYSKPDEAEPVRRTECKKVCDQQSYAINRKDSSSCQCAKPVLSTCVFYATKNPSLSNHVSQIEGIIADGLEHSQFLKGSVPIVEGTQVVVDAVSNNLINVSVFPPSNMTEWSPREATFIAYAIQNRDINFDPIGAIICRLAVNAYELDRAPEMYSKLRTAAIIGIAIGASASTVLTFALVLYAIKIKKRALEAEKLNKPFAAWIVSGQQESVHIPQLKGARWFSLEEIMSCTNDFSETNEIGEGGYGKVYKGLLPSGERVAVKRASADRLQGTTEFKTEIELLSRVHHRNLVGLIGFCFEEGQQILVYELMPNGTLRDCLSGRSGVQQLDWSKRFDLVLGSARGIAYLHTEANPPIIHGDIKSSNILLDERLVAKVADFGLSELASDGGLALKSTRVKGTLGYLDPDYYMTTQLTSKSDVYSFGVVILEVITGKLPIPGRKSITHRVSKLVHEDGGIDLVVKKCVDPNLGEYPCKALGRLLEIALICMKDDPEERLSMAEVVKELEALSGAESEMYTINMNKNPSQREGQALLPYSEGSFGSSSFEYSGSYVIAGISR